MYSVLSVLGLVLIVHGYGEVGDTSGVLYVAPLWLKHLMVVLLFPVFPLLLSAYLPGRIKAVTKHPMLLATKIWALFHIVATGSIASVVLFGAMLTWAIIDRVSMNGRVVRPVPGGPAWKYNDVLALTLGGGLYLLFIFFFHEMLIGVSPF